MKVILDNAHMHIYTFILFLIPIGQLQPSISSRTWRRLQQARWQPKMRTGNFYVSLTIMGPSWG